jgi:hypothetical protein
MEWYKQIYWLALFAALLSAASVVAGLFGAPSNIWIPLGLAGITFAVLNVRAEK